MDMPLTKEECRNCGGLLTPFEALSKQCDLCFLLDAKNAHLMRGGRAAQLAVAHDLSLHGLLT